MNTFNDYEIKQLSKTITITDEMLINPDELKVWINGPRKSKYKPRFYKKSTILLKNFIKYILVALIFTLPFVYLKTLDYKTILKHELNLAPGLYKIYRIDIKGKRFNKIIEIK